MSFYATASQTVGPYFQIGLEPFYRNELAAAGVPGTRLKVSGQVLDGEGQPVVDAVIEVWQADAQGLYPHPADTRAERPAPGFSGFGRIATDGEGRFAFSTVKPGRVPGFDERPQAPHLAVSLMMRGLLRRVSTRIYFDDEADNASDPILERVPTERRATLIARSLGASAYGWDIRMQGEAETVFFEF